MMRALIIAGVVLGLLLLALAARTANAQSLDAPPLYSVKRSDIGGPDRAGINSDDPAAGASLVTIVPPIPMVGSQLTLRIGSALGGAPDITHIVAGGDTAASIAQDFCDQINANATLDSVHIKCQMTPGAVAFGVTHHIDNLMVVTALTAPTVTQVMDGTLAWEAGATFALVKAPAGATPPIGSNCGQYIYVAPNSVTPGVASTQYVMLNCTVINPDSNHVDGEFGIYTAQTINGAWLLGRRAAFSAAA
jgi:hypothetical protein